jgi:hypothetical protein
MHPQSSKVGKYAFTSPSLLAGDVLSRGQATGGLATEVRGNQKFTPPGGIPECVAWPNCRNWSAMECIHSLEGMFNKFNALSHPLQIVVWTGHQHKSILVAPESFDISESNIQDGRYDPAEKVFRAIRGASGSVSDWPRTGDEKNHLHKHIHIHTPVGLCNLRGPGDAWRPCSDNSAPSLQSPARLATVPEALGIQMYCTTGVRTQLHYPA